MSSSLDIACPECGKSLKVPEAARGKKVRCKFCEHVFVVPMDDDEAPPAKAKPVAAKPAAPAPAKAKAKPAAAAVPVPPPPPPPPADAPLGFAKDEDEDEDEDAARPKPLGVIEENDAPRCPHCAKELDPPDTRICLNCGYDLVERRRHGSKKVYEHTTQDYFMWWLPAFAWIFVMLLVLTFEILCILKMKGWVETHLDFVVKDEKNETTNQAQYYLHPDAFTTCFSVVTLAVMVFGIRFCYKRLIKNWRPPEVEKKNEGD